MGRITGRWKFVGYSGHLSRVGWISTSDSDSDGDRMDGGHAHDGNGGVETDGR